ncbi:MAG: hypothetical protein SFY32_03510 [Bacteroidota bacterium]|nr:hypothetical protein [Bacteroidota bacterium]
MKLHSTNWIETIFQNRNKQYGAYQLRKLYDSNTNKGLIIANAIVIICLLLLFYKYNNNNNEIQTEDNSSSLISENSFEKINVSEQKETNLPQIETNSLFSDISFQFLNIEIVKEVKPKPLPKFDVKDGVLKYSYDPDTKEIFIPQKAAGFKGGWTEFNKQVTQNISFKNLSGDKYHYDNGDDEINGEINTMVFISCVITATGKMDSVEIFKGASDPKFNDRIIEAFKKTEGWIAANHKGKNVNERLIIPYHFNYMQPRIKFYNP